MSWPEAIVVGAGIVGGAGAEALARTAGASSSSFWFGWPTDTVQPPLYPTQFETLKENEA